MNVIEAIQHRHSVRHYRPDPVPDDVLARLLGAARLAPSSGNRQPWKFVVVRDPATRERLAGVCQFRRTTGELRVQRFIAEAPVVVVACGSEREANVFYKAGGELSIAPGAHLATTRTSAVTAEQGTLLADLSAALSLLMLAAVDEGLGTCWVMGVDEAAIRAMLGIPEGVRAPMVMTLGYPLEEPKATPRKPLAEIVCYERYA